MKMSLRCPTEVWDSLKSGIKRLACHAGFGTPGLQAADPEGLAVAFAHQAFDLCVDRLTASADLAACVEETGWRCLVVAHRRALALAEARRTPEGYRLALLVEGNRVSGLVDALWRAEAATSVDTDRW